MPNSNPPMFYGDIQVRQENGLISLTDMWFAANKPTGKDEPKLWKLKAGSEFIDFIAKKHNVPRGNVYKTSRGRYGGTWAHWQIALAYAKYLSPEFHAWANEVIKERVEEDVNPELGIKRSRERAISNWRKQGKSEEFIQARIAGIETRNGFTDTLDKHGIKGGGFGVCTNNIYTPIIGGTAAEVRAKKGLPKKANVRENMTIIELTGTMFAEALASDKIKREKRNGLNQCAIACLNSGIKVKSVIDGHEESISDSSVDKFPTTNSPLTDRINNLRDESKST